MTTNEESSAVTLLDLPVRTLAGEPEGHRYLLPDVCLSGGRFLDDTTPEDLPRPVEVVATDGVALRRALDAPSRRAAPGRTDRPTAGAARG